MLSCVHLIYRRYGTKCAGCSQTIYPQDLVRRARTKVFHLNCFTCMVCRKQLSTGEELYVLDENRFICKEDYLNRLSNRHSQGKIIYYLLFYVLKTAQLTTQIRLYLYAVFLKSKYAMWSQRATIAFSAAVYFAAAVVCSI